MRTAEELRRELRGMDRRSYPAYKSLAGTYQFEKYKLSIDHVQGDPFASPSSLHVEMPYRQAGIPERYYESRCAETALRDYIVREAGRQFEKCNFKAKGSGKSGLMSISRCGQEVLERSACEFDDAGIILRFHVGFPALGRTIQAKELEKILFEFLPECIENALCWRRMDHQKVEQAVWLAEDQAALRKILAQNHWVAFAANGSILPRKSGVSELPMAGSVPFKSPETLEKVIELPHRGKISGMAIPEGITLIVGGGYHGKSTLLEALQNGVYNHIGGDGRELVITDETAVKLRAEDGRSVRNVDISMFINDLPNGRDTSCFSTMDASGSTSQAAGVVESMEAGTRLLLIDEDTSATNFMVRDALMQRVISREKEPITPFIERMRALYEQAGISTILVAGSSGAFFYEADRVIQMDRYHVVDITDKVRAICGQNENGQIASAQFVMPSFNRKNPAAGRKRESMHSGGRERSGRRGRPGAGSSERPRAMKVKVMGKETMVLDKETVDLRYVEQLADSEQTAALAYYMRYLLEKNQTVQTVQETVDGVEKIFDEKGWQAFCGGYVPCGLARPRRQEIYAVLNRYRG